MDRNCETAKARRATQKLAAAQIFLRNVLDVVIDRNSQRKTPRLGAQPKFDLDELCSDNLDIIPNG